MKKVIFKYAVNPYTETMLPVGAEILSVGEQDGQIVLWAIVDSTVSQFVGRRIYTVPTGTHNIPENGNFLGTVQMKSGLVFHFFEGWT